MRNLDDDVTRSHVYMSNVKITLFAYYDATALFKLWSSIQGMEMWKANYMIRLRFFFVDKKHQRAENEFIITALEAESKD